MTKFRFVAPGRASRNISSETDVSVADLVSQFELYEFTILLNGVQVDPADFTTTVIPDGAQVMGTVATKGA